MKGETNKGGTETKRIVVRGGGGGGGGGRGGGGRTGAKGVVVR